jgi:hypothetical protein
VIAACSSSDDDKPAAPPAVDASGAGDTERFETSFGQDVAPTGDANDTDSGCTTIPDLVAWWRAEQNADDTQGTHEGSWISETGGAGKPKYATGKVGSAFDFASTLSRVQVPDDAELDFASAFSIDAWISLVGPAGTGPIFQKMTAGAKDGVMLEVFQGKLRLTVGGARVSNRDDVPLAPGKFVHVAATFTAPGALKVYIDGADATGAITGPTDAGAPTNTLPIVIGADSEQNANHFPGAVDELALYKRALTAQEVGAIFSRGSEGRCP